MKISLNWLTDYVDVSVGVEKLAALLKQIGLPVEEIVETDSDIILDVEVTSNRGDCLGHMGVAREVACVLGAEFRPPRIPPLPTSGRAADLTSVEVLDGDLCPRYTARIIRGVKVGPSPRWMVERLEAVGLRGINNVVDVTNYILMEYSQPLHSFDFEKLADRRIIVRRARAGEMLISIDQTKCELDETMLVIADARRPVAIAGVMGGLNTEVTADTVDVLIEAAQFDPLCIRRTSRKLQLMSESNYRFERGVDPVALEEASLRACQLIVESGGGSVAEGVVDVWANPWRPREVALRPARCSAVLGLDVPAGRQQELLRRLGLRPRQEAGRIVCSIPANRPDLEREIDLIEEVARLEGYDRIPIYDRITHEVVAEQPETRLRRLIGQALSAGGFDEAVTFTFVDRAEAQLLGFPRVVAVDKLSRKTNNVLRPTILPSLLKACKNNQDVGNGEVDLFEIASCFPAGGGQLPEEYVELAMVSTGELSRLRGVLESVVAQVAPRAALTIQPASAPHLAEGVASAVVLDGRRIGTLGRVAEAVQHYYGLERPIVAAAVRYQPLLDAADLKRQYRPLPKFPAVRRDLSIIVDEDVTWEQLGGAILATAQPLREELLYVTTYRGKPVPVGRKSVTVTLVYRCPERTLRGEEVDEQVEQVVCALRKGLRAELRQ